MLDIVAFIFALALSIAMLAFALMAATGSDFWQATIWVVCLAYVVNRAVNGHRLGDGND